MLRTDLNLTRKHSLAQTAFAAEDRQIRAVAARHHWHLVTVLHLQPGNAEFGEAPDPIAYLLTQVRHRRAAAVLVPDRRHLIDLQGRDCLDAIRRTCSAVTLSPPQLWPSTNRRAA